jgi:hypothetical protein
MAFYAFRLDSHEESVGKCRGCEVCRADGAKANETRFQGLLNRYFGYDFMRRQKELENLSGVDVHVETVYCRV